MYKIGIDLGGTKIEGILLDNNLKEIARERINTEQEKGYEHIISKLVALYSSLKTKCNDRPHTLGIGTPGSVSAKTGLLKNSNTTCLNGKAFLHDFKSKIQHEVAIENDANCFAMAEALMGAGQHKKSVFGVIMGTGCGGGIVINSNVLTGLQSIAGEWGHSTIDPRHGPKCYCGKKGCVETLISGGGVENRYKDLTGNKISMERILELYRKDDNEATTIMNHFFENFGIALSNVINILDPDIIILGGGLSNIPELYTLGINQVKLNVFNDSCDTPIVKNLSGDSAGVWGAALIGK